MFFLNVDGQIVRVKGYGFIDSNMMLDAKNHRPALLADHSGSPHTNPYYIIG